MMDEEIISYLKTGSPKLKEVAAKHDITVNVLKTIVRKLEKEYYSKSTDMVIEDYMDNYLDHDYLDRSKADSDRHLRQLLLSNSQINQRVRAAMNEEKQRRKAEIDMWKRNKGQVPETWFWNKC